MAVMSGDLADVKLVDLLELIHHSRLSGRLDLQRGEDRGYIYFERGNVVHAETGFVEGKDALFLLYLWNEGRFEFTPNIEPPKRTIEEDIETLVLDLSVKLDELQELKDALDPFAVPVFAEGASPEELKLQLNEWKVLAQIDGKKRIKDIADILKLSEVEVFKAIKKLMSLNLIKVKKVRPVEEVVDMKLLQELTHKLTEYIGPIAGIIMSEKIVQLGEKEREFAKSKVKHLINLLAQEIDEDSRNRFVQEALSIAKKYGIT
ncbi:MAG: hypothetical protein DRQ10_02490 [Candidatus Hydrothermota bacterium]|nr:MAG: hypothetical protein DRQ10_02490 [Candidatus Hydrothermae bacterium]